MTGPEHPNRFVCDYHTDPTSGMPWNTKVQTATGYIDLVRERRNHPTTEEDPNG